MKFRLFILLLVTCSLLFHSPPDFEAFAATNSDGTVKSAEEIDDDDVTIIDNNDRFGWSVENIGDLDEDGVNDLAVGAPRSEEPNSADNISGCCVGSKPYWNRGAVHILFMNADGSVKSTAEIIDPTTNAETKFMYNGDPVNDTGWVQTSWGDRRFLFSAGPFTLAPGDTQEVVEAIIISQGASDVLSVASLREDTKWVRLN
jgi:hypothetical protein